MDERDSLDRFLRAAAHDLQSPLGPISAFAQLLTRRYKGKLDAHTDEFLGFIVKNCAHMKRVPDAVVELGRVTTKAGPPSRERSSAVASTASNRM